jgi:beta-lactamase superfamily II metal-dependent hydrolase
MCYGPEETRAKATNAFTNFKKALADQGLSITIPKDGQSFVFGSATVTMWHIVKLNRDGSPTDDPNDNELVIRVVNGADSFLFTGDIDKDMENILVESGADIESTVLKVPHHGSASSSGYLFLREVMPRYAVISVGAKNTYGHPTAEALSMYRDLNKAGSLETLFWTWYHGDVTFVSTPDGLTVETQKTTSNDVYASPK